jgi:endonuclease YncB( thermonuclease family)
MRRHHFFVRIFLFILFGAYGVSWSLLAVAASKDGINAYRHDAVLTASTHCGQDLPIHQWMNGVVASVQDGDSLTLANAADSVRVRLDSIDAPEIDQPFGYAAKAALSKAVLGRQVKLRVSKTDRYGRLVAAVFTDDCRYLNLEQVASGWAWFYRAYACEIGANLRQRFVRAELDAVHARRGLWKQPNPVAPWFHRNGFEPEAVACKD